MAKKVSKTSLVIALSFFITLPINAQSPGPSSGEPGFIKSIEFNSDAVYFTYYGKIILMTEDGEKHYFWGGDDCSSVNFENDSNRILIEGLQRYAESAHMIITPIYEWGTDVRCLVAYTASSESKSCCGPTLENSSVEKIIIKAKKGVVIKGKKILEN